MKAAPAVAPAAAKPMRKQNEDATLAVSAEMIAALQQESEDPPPAAPPPRKPTEEATLAVPASVMAALAKEFMPDGKPLFDSKGDGDAKAVSKPAAGKPAVSSKDAPSKPGAVVKPATTSSPAKPVAAKEPTSRRDAPSTPPTAQTTTSGRTATVTPPPAKPAAADRGMAPLAPSAQSPSVTWMAMAGDDDPLAKAIAEAEAELKPAKQAAKPAPAPSKPAAAPAPAKRAAPVVSVNQAAVNKAAAAPLTKSAPEPARDDGDATMMAPMSPPSSQSPSVTWMAMAGGEDVLAAAIADAEADLGISKPKPTAKPAAKPAASAPSKPAAKPAAASPAKPAAPSSQSPAMAWMNMGGDNPLLASSSDKLAPVAGRGGRSTQEKMPPVAAKPSGGLSPDQVLAALGNRSTVEEAQLAKELGVSVAALSPALSRLEDRGAIRVAGVAGGKRVISKL